MQRNLHLDQFRRQLDTDQRADQRKLVFHRLLGDGTKLAAVMNSGGIYTSIIFVRMEQNWPRHIMGAAFGLRRLCLFKRLPRL